jgi:hypothetical protein
MSLLFAGLAAAAASGGASMALVVPLSLAGAITAASAWASYRLIARIDRLEILAAIEEPMSLPMPTFEPPPATRALSHIATP